MNIVVLAGGYSPERDVSLTSGSLIANALIENGHRVLLLDLYLGITALPSDPLTLFQTVPRYHHRVGEHVPDLQALKEQSGNGDVMIGPNVLSLCGMADRVFLALHGSMGENGQLQATLDNYGIRYTGSGFVGSLLAMDKDLSKQLMRSAEIPTPDWVSLDPADPQAEKTVLTRIGIPCVIKPSGCGSSVGVSMVESAEELSAALQNAALWGDRILAERRIVGRELTVGILDGQTLPLVEIIPREGFYDYKNKYQGCTEEICPANVSDEIACAASRLTLRGFEVLRLRGYARFDYMLDTNGQLWCLEANTLPGMTPTSLLPQAAAAAGIDYRALCEKIISL